MRTRAGISTSAIHFIISKMVSAVRTDATVVPMPETKSSSTNGLAAIGRKSASKHFFSQKKISYAPLPPENYAESIGEICF